MNQHINILIIIFPILANNGKIEGRALSISIKGLQLQKFEKWRAIKFQAPLALTVSPEKPHQNAVEKC